MAIDAPTSSTSDTQEFAEFRGLATDEKLGLLWVIYENMGGSITPAAPGATESQFTQTLFDAVKAMDESAQLAFMRDLAEKKSTEHTQTYSAFSEDNKLVFWYELAEGMAAGDIVPVPDDYELSAGASKLLGEISALEFNQQITMLRHAVLDMGA
ncbi:MAG: orange carotenoid protein N-terminal domain-containing protein [Phormidesmis sp.]